MSTAVFWTSSCTAAVFPGSEARCLTTRFDASCTFQTRSQPGLTTGAQLFRPKLRHIRVIYIFIVQIGRCDPCGRFHRSGARETRENIPEGSRYLRRCRRAGKKTRVSGLTSLRTANSAGNVSTPPGHFCGRSTGATGERDARRPRRRSKKTKSHLPNWHSPRQRCCTASAVATGTASLIFSY